MWRRGFILLLFAAGILQAFTYEGPRDWSDWFESANTLMMSRGFSGVDRVTIQHSTLTLTLDGREISRRLPLQRDYAHLLPFFFDLACRLVEPDSLPLHAGVTRDLLSEGIGIKITFDSPERLILYNLYGDILRDNPTFLGDLWDADRSNGPGESLAAMDAFFVQNGLGDLGSRFHAEALATLSDWFNLFQPDETITLPDQPRTLTLKDVSPLTVAGTLIETAGVPMDGLRVDAIGGNGGNCGNLMVLYAPPLKEMELRPLNGSLNVPLRGVAQIIIFRFNETDLAYAPRLALSLVPLASYPAQVEKVKLLPSGDQSLLSFCSTRTADVTAWVVMREDRVGDEEQLTLSGMLPAVPDSTAPLSYEWADALESPGDAGETTYHIYSLTSSGFLSRVTSVTVP